jgi:hypothetical protein
MALSLWLAKINRNQHCTGVPLHRNSLLTEFPAEGEAAISLGMGNRPNIAAEGNNVYVVWESHPEVFVNFLITKLEAIGNTNLL